MKEKIPQQNTMNDDLRTALFLWQGHPESYEAAIKMEEIITRISEMGAGLTFRIKKDILISAESRRSISQKDLEKYARVDGDSFVFKMIAKKSPEGNLHIGIKDLWGDQQERGIIDKYNFVFEAKGEHGWRTVGIFKPHEIESFTVKFN